MDCIFLFLISLLSLLASSALMQNDESTAVRMDKRCTIITVDHRRTKHHSLGIMLVMVLKIGLITDLSEGMVMMRRD